MRVIRTSNRGSNRLQNNSRLFNIPMHHYDGMRDMTQIQRMIVETLESQGLTIIQRFDRFEPDHYILLPHGVEYRGEWMGNLMFRGSQNFDILHWRSNPVVNRF